MSSGTQAVLVGFDRYEKFPDLPAVASNLRSMVRMLTDPDGLAIPAANIKVINSHLASVLDVVRGVEAAAHAATQTLIVYFAGHGTIDDYHSALHLVLPQTDPSAVDVSAVRYDSLRNRVSEGPGRRIVILDCCMSGRALRDVQSSNILDTTDIDGSVVLAACGENAIAKAPGGEEHTAFTGALLTVLSTGLPGFGEYLQVSDVFNAIRQTLLAAGMPEPQMGLRNRAANIPFGRNKAWVPAISTAPADVAPADVGPVDTIPLDVKVRLTGARVTFGPTTYRQMSQQEAEDFFAQLKDGENVSRSTASIAGGSKLSIPVSLRYDEQDPPDVASESPPTGPEEQGPP